MSSFPKASPCASGLINMCSLHWNDLQASLTEPTIKLTSASFAQPRFDDHRSLKKGRSGNQLDGVFNDQILKERRFLFIEGDGYDSGRVDHH